MKIKSNPIYSTIFLRSLLVCVLLAAFIMPPVHATEAAAQRAGWAPARSQRAPVTIITVDSTADPNISKSETCESETPCTLRRAIVQARLLSAAERPVLIAFNIPLTDTGYVAAEDIWKIELQSTSDPSVLRQINGDTIIDGSTQPGGRDFGPKIFLVGPGTGARDGLIVGENALQDGNEILNLGFQNFFTHMYVTSSNNRVVGNWFGLSDDGMSPYLRDDNPAAGSGNAGIAVLDGAANNIVQDNVFLGLAGVAASIIGEDNLFADNLIGTAYNGSTPGKQTEPSLICTPDDWLGGGGISIHGSGQIIENNVFAGLRFEQFSISTPPDAIRLGSDKHIVRNNIIGVNVPGEEIGVCGRGIFIQGGPQDNLVSGNTIVESFMSAISLNDALYNANMLRANIIKRAGQWGEVEGNAAPENAIQMGKSLPDAFETYQPAIVTSIEGTAVSGTSGANDTVCANCIVELFLDDMDLVTETLQSLAVVTATADGSWAATIPVSLTPEQSIRTTTTSIQFNNIPGMKGGTTSKLSKPYGAAHPGLTVEQTVGNDPSVCAAGTSIEVQSGTPVVYCYRATNTGDIHLTTHDVLDSQFGLLYDGLEYDLAPESSVFVTMSVVLTETTISTVTWTAYTYGNLMLATSATTTAVEVTVMTDLFVYLPLVRK